MNSKSSSESPSENEDSYFLSRMYSLAYSESNTPTANSAWTSGRGSLIRNMRQFRNVDSNREADLSSFMKGRTEWQPMEAGLTIFLPETLIFDFPLMPYF
jgi:hypothetical protein